VTRDSDGAGSTSSSVFAASHHTPCTSPSRARSGGKPKGSVY
jgi:hypothetical protein